jgi:CO/xanthine dehydrogenase Mo-binding subunit
MQSGASAFLLVIDPPEEGTPGNTGQEPWLNLSKAVAYLQQEPWLNLSKALAHLQMEPRTTTAEYDPATGNYTLYAASGRGVAKLRLDLARVLGVPTEQVRCVCGDMGGNFGTRYFFYPEYAPWAARRLGRPAKWTCERKEAFLSDYQGRDLTVEAELALDEQGKFLAVRGSNLSNLGGHAAAFVPPEGARPDVNRHSPRALKRGLG